MREPAESGDVTCAEDAGRGFERRGVHLQPSPLGLRQATSLPRLDVRAAAGGHQQPVGPDGRAGLQAEDDGRTLARRPHHRLFDSETRVSDHQHHAVRLQVRSQRGSRLCLLETKKRRAGFDYRDPGAKACEGLAKLDANGAAAENRQGDGSSRGRVA